MNKIQWEYDLVERPFCEQLQKMGWSWIEGDLDVAELTERESSSFTPRKPIAMRGFISGSSRSCSGFTRNCYARKRITVGFTDSKW